MKRTGRRQFLKTGSLALGALGTVSARDLSEPARDDGPSVTRVSESSPPFKLGLVTYELAEEWNIETIIKNCETANFEGVELRTTHRHGVEPSISRTRRAEVRKRFENSRVRLVSLGSTCEYQSADTAVVKRNIEETRRFAELARDLGCIGVKVRPNGFPPNVPHEKTLEQIGRALAQCGEAARDLGVEIWLEVHGEGTEIPSNIRRIMEACNHPSVAVCWNSDDTDVVNGSVKDNFELLKPWLRSCHINELWKRNYPWRELFSLFRNAGYDRYTFAEIPASCEPIRLMHYYRALWENLTV